MYERTIALVLLVGMLYGLTVLADDAVPVSPQGIEDGADEPRDPPADQKPASAEPALAAKKKSEPAPAEPTAEPEPARPSEPAPEPAPEPAAEPSPAP